MFTHLTLLPCVYLPFIPVFHSLCPYTPVLRRLKAPPFPPDLLDIEKDNYSQISPLRDSYSPPTHLEIVLFSFPSASFNKPVDYCTYLCVLCLSADRRPDLTDNQRWSSQTSPLRIPSRSWSALFEQLSLRSHTLSLPRPLPWPSQLTTRVRRLNVAVS